MLYTIDQNAITALEEIKKSNPLKLFGKKQATRKKPSAISVALDHDMLVSCWCVT